MIPPSGFSVEKGYTNAYPSFSFELFVNKLISMNTVGELRRKEEHSPLLMLGLGVFFFILGLVFGAVSAGGSFVLLLLSLALTLIGLASGIYYSQKIERSEEFDLANTK